MSYNASLGEERVLRAQKQFDQADHLLVQAKETFNQIDRRSYENVVGREKPILMNPASANYVKDQTPEVVRIMLGPEGEE